jgi:FtsZ-interacting cell division protein ZipA
VSAWIWVVIAVVVVVVLAVALWRGQMQRKTGKLQARFGPEYDRTVDTAGDRRAAEAELEAREERRQRLDIRPLPQASRDRYLDSWRGIQAQFVDEPQLAVESAERMIKSVMNERGYPVDDFEQRAADISVDHPDVVEHYREGNRLAHTDSGDGDSTEALRQAMMHYRTLFEHLVEADSDRPLARDESPSERTRQTTR